MCSAPPHPRPTTNRSGFTLLEVAVTLLLLVLAAALALPVLRLEPAPSAEREEALVGVIAEARALAVRRAESLHLRVDTLGGWTIKPAGGWSSESLRSGHLVLARRSALTVELSRVGACFTRDPDGLLVDWDAVRCAPSRDRR